jgi:CDP-diacylglycerol--glycerol-3-phosphate 3-phosphatidyltransferase
VQIIAIGLYILPLPAALEWVAEGAMGLAVVLTVVTGVDYVVRAALLYSRAHRPAGQA